MLDILKIFKKFYKICQYVDYGSGQFLILNGLKETLKLTVLSSLISFILGLSIGVFLYINKIENSYLKNKICLFINFIFNLLISAPFLPFSILMINVCFGRFFNFYGFTVSIFCLILVLIPIFARNCEQVFLELNPSIYETAYTLGANKKQFIFSFLLKESMPGIILKVISLFISSLSYSSVLGALGNKDLGYIVWNYGYMSSYSFQGFTSRDVIILCVIINVLIVQFVYIICIIIHNKINYKKK